MRFSTRSVDLNLARRFNAGIRMTTFVCRVATIEVSFRYDTLQVKPFSVEVDTPKLRRRYATHGSIETSTGIEMPV